MLTRLKINGFKNLVDVDIRFGPFTCVAGANGVGKSNLFDAIRFLSILADRPLVEAGLTIRGEHSPMGDVADLFHRVGDAVAPTMRFEAEMLIPQRGIDDLGGQVVASSTFLVYTLELGYRSDRLGMGALAIQSETLNYIKQSEISDHLPFAHTKAWRKSIVIKPSSRGRAFISTEDKEDGAFIRLHQDGNQGPGTMRPAANLLRTVLSSVNSAEFPTAMLARREMQSWRMLQLEPAVLRQSDNFNAPTELGADGAYLAAMLYGLAEKLGDSVYVQIANRLAELVGDVDHVWVERDDVRRLLTLKVRMRDGTVHPARSLSDGTLRFLALAVLERYPSSYGLICLEEPENGVHPRRIGAMLTLLQGIAADTKYEVDSDNPLRQVIINTHSPHLVQLVPENSLLAVDLAEVIEGGKRYKAARFRGLSGTWRSQMFEDKLEIAELLDYLRYPADEAQATGERVVDREDARQLRQMTLWGE